MWNQPRFGPQKRRFVRWKVSTTEGKGVGPSPASRGRGRERIGIRWNGGDDGPGIGNPQSRGNATWFILPEELAEVILNKIDDLAMSGPGGLIEGYRAMAKDADGEREAEEWSEGLIGDASAQG
jgi:hypothetical protein